MAIGEGSSSVGCVGNVVRGQLLEQARPEGLKLTGDGGVTVRIMWWVLFTLTGGQFDRSGEHLSACPGSHLHRYLKSREALPDNRIEPAI